MNKIVLSLSAILLASGISIASDNVESSNIVESSKDDSTIIANTKINQNKTQIKDNAKDKE